MRKSVCVLVAAMMVGMAVPSFAELQDVKVGGSLRIRGNWYSEDNLSFDKDAGNDALYVEQRTTVNVSASFTDNVNAFIELDHYSDWGNEFRGLDDEGILSGGDGTAASYYDLNEGRSPSTLDSDGSVSLYQGYIEVVEIWDLPATVRIGRQEIQLGSEFLVGNNDTSSTYRGLSFDAITTRSQFGDFKLQTWIAELVENVNPARWESSGDILFNGAYVSYAGIEDMTIDGYVMRYSAASNDVYEGLGIPDKVEFYTVGVRFAGAKAQFDWDVEGAYQFGDSGLADVPNVSSDEVSAFGGTAKAGYTFDVKTQPRIFVNGAYFSGDEEEPAFNRMFSDHEYSEFIDSTDLTNVWLIGGGVSAQVTEAIGLTGVANWFNAVESLEDALGSGAPDETSLGFEVGLYAKYDYSEDLYFQLGYAHFFAGEAIETGALVTNLGQGMIGGDGEDDDLDYVFLETGIKF